MLWDMSPSREWSTCRASLFMYFYFCERHVYNILQSSWKYIFHQVYFITRNNQSNNNTFCHNCHVVVQNNENNTRQSLVRNHTGNNKTHIFSRVWVFCHEITALKHSEELQYQVTFKWTCWQDLWVAFWSFSILWNKPHRGGG